MSSTAIVSNKDISKQSKVSIVENESDSGVRSAKKSNAKIDTKRQLLEDGLIPKKLRETLKLTPLRSKEGIAFNKAINDFLDRMYPDSYLKSKGTRFVLSSSYILSGNAAAFSHANPPIVCISDTLLNPSSKHFIKTEEALLGLLIHEETHLKIRSERNSKPEEGKADLEAVRVLSELKLNPLPYYQSLKADLDLRKQKGAPINVRSVSEVLDVHPATSTRISYLEPQITRFERLGKKISPISEITKTSDLVKANNPLVRKKFWDRLFERHNYEKKSAVEKIDFINLLFETIDLKKLSTERSKGIRYAVTKLPRVKDEPSLEVKAAYHKLADFFLTKVEQSIRDFSKQKLSQNKDAKFLYDKFLPDKYLYEQYKYDRQWAGLYQIIASKFYGRNNINLAGRLAPVATAMQEFLDAGTYSKRLSAARNFNSLIEDEFLAESPEGRAFLQTHTWPKPKLPKKVGEIVPWNEHIKDAIAEAKTGSTEILDALIDSGIEDYRLAPYISDYQAIRMLQFSELITSHELEPHGPKSFLVEFLEGPSLSLIEREVYLAILLSIKLISLLKI